MVFRQTFTPGKIRWLVIAAVALTAPLAATGVAYAALSVASDGFESGDVAGGLGWIDSWTLAGSTGYFTSGAPQEGATHLRLKGTSSATRSVDLTGESDAHLLFWAKLSGLKAANTGSASLSTDGVVFTPAVSWTQADSDGVYRSYDVDLGSLGLLPAGQVWIRVEFAGTGPALMYIDAVDVTNTVATADPLPSTSGSVITIDSVFTDWSGQAVISDSYNDQSGAQSGDLANLYWANNLDQEVNFHMVERHTTDGLVLGGGNGQTAKLDFILYVDVNDDGNFTTSEDRLVQVNYVPEASGGQARVRVRYADTAAKIFDSGWYDWGDTISEGGLRFEFPVAWSDLGFSFGSVVRMYGVSYDGTVASPVINDRIPDGTGDVQWSPASILGLWLLAALGALGILAIWYFRGRRVWT